MSQNKTKYEEIKSEENKYPKGKYSKVKIPLPVKKQNNDINEGNAYTKSHYEVESSDQYKNENENPNRINTPSRIFLKRYHANTDNRGIAVKKEIEETTRLPGKGNKIGMVIETRVIEKV